MEIDDLVGATIAGRFSLGKKLGQGGYGAVFEGEQISVGRKCAVKILAPRVTNDPKTSKRFEHEARTTSLLAHPNTVVIYDFGRDPERDILYLAMEFLEGESLDDLIDRRGVLDVAESLHIAHQIAQSLDDAHRSGVVHRDVKPQNVMLMERGGNPTFVKVIDFGLVKIVSGDVPTKTTFVELTKSGVVVGTPAYMSPEQIDSGSMDGRTDQYSLAITIYAMLTGRTPFIGANPIDVATKHLLERPLPPSAYRSGLRVSDTFEQALMKALSKNPDDRYETCTAFVEALVDASTFEGIDAISSNVTMRDRPSATADEKTTEPTAPSQTDTMKMFTEDIDEYGETELLDSDEVSAQLESTVKTVRAVDAPTSYQSPPTTTLEVDDASSATLVAPDEWPDFDDSQSTTKRSSGMAYLIALLFLIGVGLIGTAIYVALSS